MYRQKNEINWIEYILVSAGMKFRNKKKFRYDKESPAYVSVQDQWLVVLVAKSCTGFVTPHESAPGSE
jgi:hypothetical protein